MDKIIENIKTRRSIRSFKDEPVPKKIIEQLIECARYAPSAMNSQPWNFIAVTKKDLIQEVSEKVRKNGRLYLKLWPLVGLISKSFWKKKFRKHIEPYLTSEHDTIFYNAPCIVFITAKKTYNSILDCSCAAQNLMLAAHSLGLGTCWIGYVKFLDYDKKMLNKLGVAKGDKIIAPIIIGYPKVAPKALPRKETKILFH